MDNALALAAAFSSHLLTTVLVLDSDDDDEAGSEVEVEVLVLEDNDVEVKEQGDDMACEVMFEEDKENEDDDEVSDPTLFWAAACKDELTDNSETAVDDFTPPTEDNFPRGNFWASCLSTGGLGVVPVLLDLDPVGPLEPVELDNLLGSNLALRS